MMNKILSFGIAFLFLLSINSLALAQTSLVRNYKVTQGSGEDVKVETSSSRQAVTVSISRKDEPTHYYLNYPQVAVTKVQFGKRNDVFTHYINAKRVESENFSLDLNKISGNERKNRTDIKQIKIKLTEDMKILRAIREFDKTADTLLAELAYVVLTYDDSIIDGEAPDDLTVQETSRKRMKKVVITPDYTCEICSGW